MATEYLNHPVDSYLEEFADEYEKNREMNLSLFEYAAKDYDWITMEWTGGGSDEEDALTPESCMTPSGIWLPIQGPVNKDGSPLGYLLITE